MVIAVDASSTHECIDEWCPTASTLCPPQSSSQKIGHSYAQNEAQKDHLQRISWLLMTPLNATFIMLRC